MPSNGRVRFQDYTDPVADSVEVAESHRLLLQHLETVDPDPELPSRLPDWTIGHVITHLARNADSHRSMLANELQYDDGWTGRDRDILGGGGRPWTELRDDLATAAARLDLAYRSVADWDQMVQWLAGPRPAGFLPLARRREIEVHRVDLGVGYEFVDVPIDFVARDSRLLQAWWQLKNRRTNAGLPTKVATLDTRGRWAWLVGRLHIDGTPNASLF